MMGFLLFPLLGLGLLAVDVGLGIASLSRAMLLICGVVMSMAYAALNSSVSS